ncbi:MAG: helix-turn-helix transcriptional regulator [Bacteriovorax sp.]
MTTKKIKYGLPEFERDYGPQTFAKMLEAHRLCDEISQKDLAKKLKISQSSLCDLEKGRKIPSPKRAAQIAKILGYPPELWVLTALQDQVNEAGIKLKLAVA